MINLKFVSIASKGSNQRNFDYQVLLDGLPIGIMQATFKGSNSTRLWKFPAAPLYQFTQIDTLKTGIPSIPLRKAKAVVRNLMLKPRDLSQITHLDIMSLIEDSYQDWLQKTPKEKKEICRRVPFVRTGEPVIPQQPPTLGYFYRPYDNHHDYYLSLDGKTQGIMMANKDTVIGSPRWSLDQQLAESLKIHAWIQNQVIPMPFHHCKAFIRHVLQNSVSFKKLDPVQIEDLAKFAYSHECQERTLKKAKGKQS